MIEQIVSIGFIDKAVLGIISLLILGGLVAYKEQLKLVEKYFKNLRRK